MRDKKMMGPKEIDEIVERKLRDLKIIKDVEEPRKLEEELMPHPKLPVKKLPHEHKKLELDLEEQFHILVEIFGDESTADAVIKTFRKSPLEIQLIAKMIIDLHEKFNDLIGE